MTGIERLYEVVRELGRFSFCYDLYETLGNIADQIEREHDAEVADSPYDAITPEDRDAIAWVRDHGGLEVLRRMFQDADSRRVELCGALGIDLDKGWSEAMAAMRLRLMPEGMTWPMVDGEPVRIGDVVSDVEVRSVVFRDDGILLSDCTSVPGWGTWRSYKEPIKRPAPKAPDADGVEIRVGDEVWDVDGSGPFIVSGFVGEPLAVVFEIAECNDLPRKPSQLTHTKPEIDTWERIEEDAEKDPCDYFGFDGEETCGKCPASGKNCEQTMALDIVRRCRALAERERGE